MQRRYKMIKNRIQKIHKIEIPFWDKHRQSIAILYLIAIIGILFYFVIITNGV